MLPQSLRLAEAARLSDAIEHQLIAPQCRRRRVMAGDGLRPSLWRFVGLVRHYPISRSARPARPPRSALVVALHGCTQTAHAYERGTGWSDLADRYGFVVIYPQQQPANNP